MVRSWNAERTENRIDDPGEGPVDPYAMEDPHGSRAVARRRALRRRTALSVGGLLAAMCLVAVGLTAYDRMRPPDIGDYAQQGIEIVGLADEPFSVTPAELAELECVRMSAEGEGAGAQGESKAGTVDAYGPELSTFLAQHGFVQGDFARIVVECKDDFDVALHGEMLEGQVVISIAEGKDALEEYARPARLVIPSEASGMWAYGIERMTFYPLESDADAAAGEGPQDGAGEASPDAEEKGEGASKGAFSYDREEAAGAAGKEA